MAYCNYTQDAPLDGANPDANQAVELSKYKGWRGFRLTRPLPLD
jgi:hypothetical protein